MPSRVSLSRKNLGISEVAQHQEIAERSLRYLYNSPEQHIDIFGGSTPSEVRDELQLRLSEEELHASLSLLAAVEAAFRVDYLQRAASRGRDELSRGLRTIYSEKGSRASFEDDILEVWAKSGIVKKSYVGEIRSALKLRHWLAHGRYWVPKFGQKYDFYAIHSLATVVFSSFPLRT